MNTIARYLKIYTMVVSQYVKSRMQYRADFIVGMFGMLASNLANVVILWLVFANIPSIKGWNYNELLFFYGFFILALTPQQLFFDMFWDLGHLLQTGDFIRYYFRPINMMFYFISWRLDIKGITQLLVGIAVTIYASIKIGIIWTLPMALLLFINWVSASLIMIALLVGGMSSAFWIINANSLTGTITSIRDFGRYPLDIFNKTFRIIFTFVAPIGFLAYYPTQIALRPASEIPAAAWFSPIIGFVMFFLAYQIWRKGINSYSGTGS